MATKNLIKVIFKKDKHGRSTGFKIRSAEERPTKKEEADVNTCRSFDDVSSSYLASIEPFFRALPEEFVGTFLRLRRLHEYDLLKFTDMGELKQFYLERNRPLSF